MPQEVASVRHRFATDEGRHAWHRRRGLDLGVKGVGLPQASFRNLGTRFYTDPVVRDLESMVRESSSCIIPRAASSLPWKTPFLLGGIALWS